jgi:hypothetical protein
MATKLPRGKLDPTYRPRKQTRDVDAYFESVFARKVEHSPAPEQAPVATEQPSTDIPSAGPPSKGSPSSESPTSRSSSDGSPSIGAVSLGSPSVRPLSIGPPSTDIPQIVVPVDTSAGAGSIGSPSTGSPAFRPAPRSNGKATSRGRGTVVYYVPGQPRWYRVESIQDGLNTNELTLLKAMWSWRESVAVNAQEKELSAGIRTLAYVSGLHPNNVRLAISSLVEKHAIRVHKPDKPTGIPKYTIPSYSAILRTWKALGLQYVVWTKGRARLYANIDNPIEPDPVDTDPIEAVPAEPPSTGAPIERPEPLILFQKNNHDSSTPKMPASADAPSTGSPRDVAAVDEIEWRLSQTKFRSFDRKAIETIWAQGREAVPDVTPEEICEVFLEQAGPLLGNRRVDNLNGLVLDMWKWWLTPIRLKQLRQAERQRREQGRELHDPGDTERYLAVIDDPNASEPEKRLALAILGKT